jgi:hypothetical protein
MIELFYGLYKKQKISQIMYTFIASILLNGLCEIKDKKLHIVKVFFPKEINNLINSIRIDKNNMISWQKIVVLNDYFLAELRKCAYCRKIPILGIIRTNKFWKTIKKNIPLLNESIRLYIEKNDIKYLEEINPILPQLRFKYENSPVFNSFYRDSNEAANIGVNITRGFSNTNNYDHYYSKSGTKLPIK